MPKDLARHLGLLDHASLVDLVHDARVIELVDAVVRQRGLEMSRGQLVLDAIGGATAILDVPTARKKLILSLSESDEDALKKAIGVEDLYSMHLTAPRRELLYGFFGLTPVEIPHTLTPPSVTAVNVAYGLFPHQNTALLECINAVETPGGRVMLHMPTGAGKTRTAMHLICRHLNRRVKGVVVWLVAGLELCEQAAQEFRLAWSSLGGRPLVSIRLWGGPRGVDAASFTQAESSSNAMPRQDIFEARWPESFDDGVIIASLDTAREMLSALEPGEKVRRAKRVSLIVFDEAHRALAPMYHQVVNDLSMHGAGLLGLSATPGRKHQGADSAGDDALATLFGQNKVVLTIPNFSSPVEGLISQGYLARLRHVQLDVAEHSTSNAELKKIALRLAKSFDFDEESLRVLGLDAMRNLQIVDKLESLLNDEHHKRIIAFAPSVVASNLISNLLNARGIVSYSVHAETPKAIREHAIAEFRNNSDIPMVMCNYGVLTAGFDAPRTSAVLIARPTTSIVLLSQMAGRALRGKNVGGNSEATLVTVADTTIPELVDTVRQFHAFDSAWLSAEETL